MSNNKQCSDHMNQGIGNLKVAPKRLPWKAPTLKGGLAPKGVPTSKQGQ